jgi:RNA polymerase sigma-70 factor (ECF subfamily)
MNPPLENPGPVSSFVAAAKVSYPDLFVEDEVVTAHLSRLQLEPSAVAVAHRGDLALAAACAAGDPAAHLVFDRVILSGVGDFVARIDSSPAFAAEVRQDVREKLLLGAREDGRVMPRIADYAGRGPLGGWVRVVSVRTAIDLRRGREQVPGRAVSDEVAEAVLSPELSLLKHSHRGACQDAFDAGLAALTARERNILRLHFADQWSLERLATTYKVHRATVARWLSGARETLLATMADRLGVDLGMGPDEVQSLVGLLRSQLDLSLTRFD